ncbi:hypothetical protein SRABI133_00725 [Peribacillus simplex]|uniref:Uncharacterized protein n=1 Tax=Peribacillus simplex TaxID=1478 RepID=A0A9W4KRL0_9BACI|nr:hypothetical protein SRABI133_00725 [Peribacillus simplex]
MNWNFTYVAKERMQNIAYGIFPATRCCLTHSNSMIFEFTAIFKGEIRVTEKRNQLYMRLTHFSSINTLIWYYKGIDRALEGMNK